MAPETASTGSGSTVVPDRLAAENPFKAALAARTRQIGLWSALTSNILAEIIGDEGFDWVLLDTEHAPNDLSSLIGQLQALRGSGTQPVVRPAANDPVLIKRLLDIGFRNVLVPFVQTVEEADRAVAATRYPPLGIRGVSAYQRNNGYGRVADYFGFIDAAIAVIVQIETGEAAGRVAEIAAVPGVDAVFVGPGDLAASLGHLGNTGHADVQECIREIGAAATAAGAAAGVVAGNPADAERYLNWGYCFTTVGSDVALFRGAVSAAAEAARKIGPQPTKNKS